MRNRKRTSRLALAAAIVGAALLVAPAFAGGPVTKQNGSTPAFDAFTSICAVPGYASYGNCGGDVTTYTNVSGRIDAVQPKPGRYNLNFTFRNLTPGVSYRLWGTAGSGFFEIGTTAADDSGVASFSYQTTSPVGLGFDLNIVNGDVTVVTSYWSGQLLAMNPDGTLYAA